MQKLGANTDVIEELPFMLTEPGPGIVLTIGLPRCGKSMWALATGYPIICPDSIRAAIHGYAFIPETERIVWTHAHYMVKALLFAGHQELIFDATNTTRKRREEWEGIRIPPYDTDIPVYFAVFHTPMEVCIARARASRREDLIPVIQRMNDQFEPLTDEERSRVVYEDKRTDYDEELTCCGDDGAEQVGDIAERIVDDLDGEAEEWPKSVAEGLGLHHGRTE